jgi:glyoxylase-like metal-dependent hydrolase (beta-lactamase superfamily II)
VKTSFWRFLVCSLVAVSAAAAAPVGIAPGVHLLRGEFVPGRQPDGNSVIFTAPVGLIVVDTGRHVAHTQALLDFAAAQKKPIAAAINTHWHLDHTGGNVLLRREVPKVKIYASSALDGALQGFLANSAKQLEAAIAQSTGDVQQRHRTELALIQSGKLAPDHIVKSSGTKTIAGRKLKLHLETHAVTAGDVWILDEKSGTLVAGDLVTLPFPFLDTACPERWKASLARVSGTKFKRLVPGHGPVMTRKEFEQYRGAYDALLACAASDKTNEQCASGWIDGAGALVPQSEHDFVREAIAYYADNFLRPAARAKTAHLCGG